MAEVSVDSFYGCEIALMTCSAADAVFQRILWRYDQIDHIEASLFNHVPYDGEMTDVQRIE